MTHSTHTIHENSSEAFAATRDLRDTRREAVYQTLLRGPMTDRQVAQTLGFADMNAVRPRLTSLLQDYWVEQTGVTQCPVTNRRVRVCKALRAEERSALILSLRSRVDVAGAVQPVGTEVAA